MSSISITDRMHELLRPHLRPGDVAIDATAGNGHDTRFLAECVGCPPLPPEPSVPTTSPSGGEVGLVGVRESPDTSPTQHLPPGGGGRRSSEARTAGGGELGLAGRVFAFDVQKIALEHTAARCSGFGNVTLFERSHAEMREAIPAEFHGHVAAVMFNFGYLPNGDRTVVTHAASSVAAIRAAVPLLRPGGCLTAIIYPGHPGGDGEAEAVESAFRTLPFAWHCESSDHPRAPRLWLGTQQNP